MSDTRPNILFIFPDQWRADGLSCMGNPIAETPFVDQLAREGVLFTAAYSNCPSCIAARACLMTGQTPATVGRHGYQDGNAWPYENMFPQLLRDSGYQTMVSGKTHFCPPRANLGFEEMALYDNQRWGEDFKSDYDRWIEDKTDGLIEDTAQQLCSNSMIVHPWTHDEALHVNSWTVTEAITMLKRRDKSRPFFLQLGFHRPHPPLDPPAEYLRRFEQKELPDPPVGDWAESFADHEWRPVPAAGKAPPHMLDRLRRAYYAQICHLDFQIGRIQRWLQLRGMLNKTLIIFSSDHGEMLADHNLFRKTVPFEGAAKVPLIIRPPHSWQLERGRRDHQPVALHDIMPSLLEAAGVDIPESAEGKSLLPLVRGEQPEWREYIQFEHIASQIGPWQGLCNGKEKYVWQTESGDEYFFDLENDPLELTNQAQNPEFSDRVAHWRQRLADYLRIYEADRLVKDGNLNPGSKLPVARDWLNNSA